MKTTDAMKDAMKATALALADEHRDSCNDPACPVTLSLLAELLLRAGVRLSPAERLRFL